MREWLKRTLTNRWMNDATVLAQIGHFLGAYSIVLTVAFLTDKTWPTLITATAMMVYATVKEHWYDANYEIPKQTSYDNWLDWSFYGVGCLVSIGVAWYKLRGK